jgi:hypothetical protein
VTAAGTTVAAGRFFGTRTFVDGGTIAAGRFLGTRTFVDGGTIAASDGAMGPGESPRTAPHRRETRSSVVVMPFRITGRCRVRRISGRRGRIRGSAPGLEKAAEASHP